MSLPNRLVSRGREITDPASVRKLVRKSFQVIPVEHQARVNELPLQPDTVLYESFAGNGMLCNPEAIFRALLVDSDQQHLQHVWALNYPRRHAETIREFAHHPRVRFVRRGGAAYRKVLATAGLLVNNATFPATFGKRAGQIYLNTWHGTPLKQMGYDEPGGAWGARNTLRNFMMADYLVSSSPFMTEVMYEQAYRLANVAPGQIMELGQPRTDRQSLDEGARAALLGRLRTLGLKVTSGEVVVLYAPTWKGTSFQNPENDAHELAERTDALQRLLPAGHRVLLKVHQQTYGNALAEPALAGRLVPNHLPTNEVLGISDVLVTDYSSIFFDFLSTGRPVIFLAPDRDDYDGYRGRYLQSTELPGPEVTTLADLAVRIAAIGDGSHLDPEVTHRRQYAAARQRFAPWDDGGATRRVIDAVLGGSAEGSRVRPTVRDGRRTMLIYLGGMTSNGITSSALNLLRNIDHRRWDVSALVNESHDQDRRHNISAIDPRVRLLVRPGGGAMSKRDRGARRQFYAGLVDTMNPITVERVEALLTTEWRRIVGAAHFDEVIDFSGYSPAWSFLMSRADAGSRAIWQHNDLYADQQRLVGHRRPHFDNLNGVFSSYRRFDRIVSVSAALRDINVDKLSRWAPAGDFRVVRNTIDYERILRLATEEPPAGLTPSDGEFTFVSVGRLSPEKNHERLVEAFARVHEMHSQARLVLVGAGPLEGPLIELVRQYGLGDVVTLAGPRRNPWSIMRACSCFVMSSDYEGQPMVILEARVLGLPVVTVAFDSVGSALDPGVGIVVERSVEALAGSMAEAIVEAVPNPPFDAVTYNREVMAEFEKALTKI